MSRLKRKTKEEMREEYKEMQFFVTIILGVLLITIFVLIFTFQGIDKGVRCKEIHGHYCTKYEIEKMED